MTLIKCGECGKEFSDKTKTCIHCGCPNIINKQKKEFKIDKRHYKPIIITIGVILGIIILIFIVNLISKRIFIKSYIGGYNTPLLNNTWVKEWRGSDNKLFYIEELNFYNDYSCHYSKIYKEKTFTLGNNTIPTLSEIVNCYYKTDDLENNSNENIDENHFNITIYKLDFSKKESEIIHKLYYYNNSDYNTIYLGDSTDVYEPFFRPQNPIYITETNNNTNTNTSNNTINKNNDSANIKTITYDEYKNLINKKNTFVLIAVNDYTYSNNYKNEISKISNNYTIPFYYYDVDFENNVLNIQGYPTTLIIKNGVIIDSFEGYVENITLNTLNNKLTDYIKK